jgi:cytoskeletal protein RodZ
MSDENTNGGTPGGESTSGETLEAFGRWLVRERELRGLGRDEVVRATKIAPAVVEALESGEAARIPPHAYVVGYLRAYAAAVGLDADEVVLRFEEAAPAADAAASGPRSAPIRIVVAVAVVLGAAALAAVAWALLRP